MKNKKRLAILVGLLMSMTVSTGALVLTTSGCDEEKPPIELETLSGVYYMDVDGQENEISFDGSSFRISFANETREGTYTYDGKESVSLKFSDGETLSANFVGGALNVEYNGVQYNLLPKIEYTVTYDVAGGSAVAADEVVNGRTLAKPQNPVKEGYVFVGWYEDSAHTQPFRFETTRITADKTLYALFVEAASGNQEFTVNLNLGYEGAPVETITTVGGKLYNLPEPVREGYNFIGWWTSDYESADKLTAKCAEGQEIYENTSLYAVWESDGTAISVTSTEISWSSVGVNKSYKIKITAPDNTVEERSGSFTSLAYDFSSKAEGDYVIEITVNGVTSTAYYKNKALARVSLFRVDGSVFSFNAVDNAEKYLLSYDCGTEGHSHADIDLGTATAYDFSLCDMQPGGILFTVRAVAEGYVTSQSKVFAFERNLSSVGGFSVDKATESVVWEAVENATSYVVEMTCGDVTKTETVTANSYSVEQYYGEINFKIYPVAHGYNSSEAVEYTYDKTRLTTPVNVHFEGNSIVWNAVQDAQYYRVSINGEEHIVPTNSLSLAAEYYEGNQLEFVVNVQALAANAQNNSLYGDSITVKRGTMNDNLRYVNGEVYWDPVVGADHYVVKVNDGEEWIVSGEYSKAAVTLTKEGVNTISVRSSDSGVESSWVSMEVEAYSIAFDSCGGNAVATKYIARGDSLTLPFTTRIGYTLLGWYSAETGGQKYTDGIFNGDSAVYYANWASNAYSVKLVVPEAEGSLGDQNTQIAINYGEIYTLPVPECNDPAKAFGGWYTEVGGNGIAYTDPEGTSYKIWNGTNSVTLYPRWIEAFTYNLISDGTATGKAYSISKGAGIIYLKSVKVPDTYNGLPVTTVEGSAFSGCTRLETIYIPDTIVNIVTGDAGSNGVGSAFQGCTSLREVNIYEVPGNHEIFYESIDGVLFYHSAYNGTELACFPITRTGAYRIPDIVTSIPLNAFKSSKIESITIPASVTFIGEQAFGSCYSLKEVIFESAAEGETAKPLTFGDKVFYYCKLLEEITLPARLESLDVNVFTSCAALQRVNLEVSDNATYTSQDGVIFTDNGTKLFYCPVGRTGSYTIPRGVSVIGESAFYGCSNLTEIIIPGYVTTIEKEAFRSCSGLVTLTFEGRASDPALTIKESAFYYCSGLTEVVLPENLQILEKNAFGLTTKLTKVTVNTVYEDISYDNGAFASTSGSTYVTHLVLGKNVAVFDINGVFGATSLENVSVDPENQNYTAEDGVLYDKAITKIVYYPNAKEGDYELPSTIQEIGARVFYKKTGITSIKFSKDLTRIGESAFEGCIALVTAVFEEGGTSPLTIEKAAFKACNQLTTVELPVRLETIGDSAFEACSNITEAVIPEGVTSIGHTVYRNCTRLTYVSIPSTLTVMGVYDDTNLYTYNGELYYDTAHTSIAQDPGIDVFDDSGSITTITVAENNPVYGVFNNVLCGKTDGVLTTIYYSPYKNGGTDGVITIPSTITTIKDRAFYSSKLITEIVFEASEGNLAIGSEAFYLCSVLSKISLPKGLTTISQRMFASATSLEEIVIPNTVTLIDVDAFSGCVKLTDVLFEAGGTEPLVIANGNTTTTSTGSAPDTNYHGAFAGCRSIIDITFPERTTEIGDYAFSYSSKNGYSVKTNEMAIQSVTLPSTLTRVGKYAFNEAAHLTTVNFTSGGNAELAIENYAFYKAGVQNLNLSNNVVSIGTWAFHNTDITNLTISASVQTIGPSAFYACSSLATVTFAEGSRLTLIDTSAFSTCKLLSEINLGNCQSLTSIGGSVFSNDVALTAIEIPASVQTIGSSAFYGCTSLASVTFLTKDVEGDQRNDLVSVGASVFNSTALTQLVFPESTAETTTLGANMFQACKNLTTVHLSTSITNIDSVFAKCMSIKTITIQDGNPNLKAHESEPLILNLEGTAIRSAFGPVTTQEGVYTIPSGFTEISSAAFYGQNGIKKLVIPETVQVIGANAFQYCRNLQEIEFKEGSQLTSLGDYAFAHCYTLQNIALPEGLTTIGKYAFIGNSSLITAYLPSTLKNIGNYAFQNCQNLYKVNVPAFTISTTYAAQSMFATCYSLKEVTFSKDLTSLSKYMFQDCISLESVALPKITRSDTYEFDGCTSLKEVLFTEGTTVLGNYMFNDCTSLQYIDLPDTITNIGAFTFQNSGLKEITIPISVTQFGGTSTSLAYDTSSSIFKGCVDLEKVILHDQFKKIGALAFSGCINLKTIQYLDTQKNEIVGDLGVVTLPPSLELLGNSAFGSGRKTSTSTTLATYPCGIEKVIVPASVTTMGLYLFQECATLLEAEVYGSFKYSTSATAFSTYTFDGCVNLKRVVLNDSITALPSYTFRNCSSLETVQTYNSANTDPLNGDLYKVTLPSKLTAIYGYSFQNASSITEVTVPRGVTKFQGTSTAATYSTSAYTFDGCTNLSKVVLHDDFTVISAYVFRGCENLTTIQYMEKDGTEEKLVGDIGVVTLPSSLTTIGNHAFSSGRGTSTTAANNGCGITHLIVPAKTTIIGNYAFQDCANLVMAEIYGKIMTSATAYATYAFDGCTKLENVILNDANVTLGNYTFRNCASLTSLKLYNAATKSTTAEDDVIDLSTVKTLGTYLFYGCSMLDNVILNSTVKTIPTYMFYNCESLKTVRTSDGGEDNAVDLSNVTTIGTYAFYGCKSLSNVLLNMNVTAIDNYVFTNCSSLETIALPTALKTIGTGAFNNTGLTSVVLPNGLTSIGMDAFLNNNLTSVTLPASVTKVDLNAFNGRIEIKVDSANGVYATDNGALFNTTDGTIVRVPTSYTGEFTVPEGAVLGGYSLNGCTKITKIYATADQITANSFVDYWGDIVITGGTEIPNSAFANYRGKSIVIEEGVTSIGSKAFYSCTNLENVVLPEGITSIGAYAFQGCSKLQSVVLPEGITALKGYTFSDCVLLSSVTLPSTIETMSTYEFYGCTSLSTITLPASLQTVGGYLFNGCTNLTEVTIPSFTKCTSTSASAAIFKGCTSLKKITLGENAVAIPNYMCQGITSLTTVELSSSVATIGTYAFDGCTNLTTIVIPEGVTSVGSYAFRNTSLTSVVLPSTLTSIGLYAFDGCAKLQSVDLPSTVTTLGNYAFRNCVMLSEIDLSNVINTGTYTFYGCTALASVTLSEECTTIGDYAFYDSGLTSIYLPGTVKVGQYAFAHCLALKSVVYGEGIQSTGEYAFNDCTALTSVTLPESLTLVYYTFKNCTALTRLVIPASVTNVYLKSFEGWTEEQTIVIKAYALDGDCAWTAGWYTGSKAKIEVEVLYDYDEPADDIE